MAFELPDLPYSVDALEPYMSAETLKYHHGKHHRHYVDALNKLIADSPLEDRSLEEIVRASAGAVDEKSLKIFNNAAQVWNHNFFWESMAPMGGGEPSVGLTNLFAKTFGHLGAFKKAFHQAGMDQFGSGYAWLVLTDNALAVRCTANGYPPFVDGQVPLLCCDVWEHAYYLDYLNRRQDFLTAFLDHLVDWAAVEERVLAFVI